MCDILHLLQCPCFFGETHRYQWPLMREIIKQWQQVDNEVITIIFGIDIKEKQYL